MKIPYYLVSEALDVIKDQEAAGFVDYKQSLANVLVDAMFRTTCNGYDLVIALRAVERVVGQWLDDRPNLFVPRPRMVLIDMLSYAKRKLR